MLGGRPWSEWIADYAHSHQQPVNRFCPTLGIPLIALSIPLGVATLFVRGLWPVPLAMFLGMGFPAPRPCGGEASGVLPRLAFPLRRVALVGGQGSGSRVIAAGALVPVDFREAAPAGAR